MIARPITDDTRTSVTAAPVIETRAIGGMSAQVTLPVEL
jgi:hypothetical protein